jgi:hypothetical protein
MSPRHLVISLNISINLRVINLVRGSPYQTVLLRSSSFRFSLVSFSYHFPLVIVYLSPSHNSFRHYKTGHVTSFWQFTASRQLVHISGHLIGFTHLDLLSGL